MAPSSAITPGQRLLATVVDNLATSSPTKELGVIPMDDGFKTVSASELSDAVNAMAWWIEEHVGKVDQPETIAFMGATDIRYLVFVLACHKTGYKVCNGLYRLGLHNTKTGTNSPSLYRHASPMLPMSTS